MFAPIVPIRTVEVPSLTLTQQKRNIFQNILLSFVSQTNKLCFPCRPLLIEHRPQSSNKKEKEQSSPINQNLNLKAKNVYEENIKQMLYFFPTVRTSTN